MSVGDGAEGQALAGELAGLAAVAAGRLQGHVVQHVLGEGELLLWLAGFFGCGAGCAILEGAEF